MLIKYQLKRSKKRKTLAIKIKFNQVMVYAPYYLPINVVEDWLSTKQVWIEKHLRNQQNRPVANSILQQQNYVLLGQTYALRFEEDAIKSDVIIDDVIIQINTSKRVKHIQEKQLKLLMSVVSARLTQYCEIQASHMANKLGVSFSNVSVKHIRSRWGSCDSKGRLQFNLQLASAPLWVIDYVVAHEVAHLQVMDHSKRFWQVVKRIYPDYLNAEKWLKNKGFELDIFKI